MVPLLLAAVLALTAVAVADRVEQRLVAPAAPAADVSSPDAASEIAAAPVATPLTSQTPLTSAALPAGEMVLTFADGSAAISTGANDPIFELGTTTIGDVDLSGVEPVLAQGDAEVSADWGDVTEWYRPTGDGIEHGYTVDAPVSTGDDLTVTVDVVDGEPTLVDGQTVAIERAEGGIVWYRGLFAFDADGTDLPAEMGVVDGDIELRVDTAGAEYPITIDPTISELQKLVTITDAAGDRFGESVAIDGVPGDMTIVVGAVGADGEQGAAYVFRDEGFGGWFQAAKLLPPTPGDRQFGWDVDVRGDVVVVGAPGDDANGPDAGAVYVFETAGPFEPWQQTVGRLPVRPVGRQPVRRHRRGRRLRWRRLRVCRRPDRPVPPGRRSSASRTRLAERGCTSARAATGRPAPQVSSRAPNRRPPVTSSGMPSPERMPARTSSWGPPATTLVHASMQVGPSTCSGTARLCLRRSGWWLATNPTGMLGPPSKWRLDAQGDVWMFSGQPVNTRFEDGTQPGDSFALAKRASRRSSRPRGASELRSILHLPGAHGFQRHARAAR